MHRLRKRNILSPPPTLSTYNKIRNNLLQSSKHVAEDYQQQAVEEEIKKTAELDLDINPDNQELKREVAA